MAKAIEQYRSGLMMGHGGLGYRGGVAGSVRQQVHDGDTVNVRAIGNFGIRFFGVDVPERRQLNMNDLKAHLKFMEGVMISLRNRFTKANFCIFTTLIALLIGIAAVWLSGCENSNSQAHPRGMAPERTAFLDISGTYYAGRATYIKHTGLYPNTFPRTIMALEVFQRYPGSNEITVKIYANFYRQDINNTDGATYVGYIKGIGSGSLTAASNDSLSGSYPISFEVEDYFTDGTGPSSCKIKFSLTGHLYQFAVNTVEIADTTPVSINNVMVIAGSMTITDTCKKVFPTQTSVKQIAAKRWLNDTPIDLD